MANPRHAQRGQTQFAYDPRFQQRASDPNNLMQQFMAWMMANQMAQQAEKQTGNEEVVQLTEDAPVGNPYMDNIHRPSPRVGSLSPLGRFNDMGNRMAAERQKRWADARAAVQQTYANQPQPTQGVITQVEGVDPTGGPLQLDSPYGAGSSFVDPEMSYEDFMARRHHDRYNPKPKVPPVGWDDPRLLEEINKITKQITGRR